LRESKEEKRSEIGLSPSIEPTLDKTKLQRFLKRYSNWLSFCFFLVTSCIQLFPLPTNLTNTLFDLGDPADSTYRISAIANNLLHNPLNLYQTNALYPAANAIALDELLTGNALLVAPLVWLTNNPILAFNFLILAAYVLSGFSMWLVVVKLTGSKAAGLVAGLIYAFSPWHMSHYAHVGITSQQWMIFALYFLLLYLEKSPFSRRAFVNLSLFALFFWLQILVAGYLAFFAAIMFSIYLLYHFGFKSGLVGYLLAKIARSHSKKAAPEYKKLAVQLLSLAGIAVVILAAVLPFVLPFLENQQKYEFKRSLQEARYWSAAPQSLLQTNPQSWQYRSIERGIFNLQTSAERAMYPGLSVLALAVLGLALARKQGGARWAFALVALAGLLLTFGPALNLDNYGQNPTDITLPYSWLYQIVPGFDSLRVPFRFAQLLMLGLAVCAGYGVAALQRLKWNSKVVAPVLVGLIAISLVTVDFFAPGWPFSRPPITVGLNENAPELYKWFANAPEANLIVPLDALMVDLPLSGSNSVNTRPDYLVYGLELKRPLLNGSANILPTGYSRMLNELNDFPADGSIDMLEGLGVKFAVIHKAALTEAAKKALPAFYGANGRLEVVKDFNEQMLVRLKPSGRYIGAAILLPPGAKVLLPEDPKAKNLALHALPGLLGNPSGVKFYTPYRSIYSDLQQVQQATSNTVYDYAFIYRWVSSQTYGFYPSEIIWQNEFVQLFQKTKP